MDRVTVIVVELRRDALSCGHRVWSHDDLGLEFQFVLCVEWSFIDDFMGEVNG
jgi:hypothetical protein